MYSQLPMQVSLMERKREREALTAGSGGLARVGRRPDDIGPVDGMARCRRGSGRFGSAAPVAAVARPPAPRSSAPRPPRNGFGPGAGLPAATRRKDVDHGNRHRSDRIRDRRRGAPGRAGGAPLPGDPRHVGYRHRLPRPPPRSLPDALRGGTRHLGGDRRGGGTGRAVRAGVAGAADGDGHPRLREPGGRGRRAPLRHPGGSRRGAHRHRRRQLPRPAAADRHRRRCTRCQPCSTPSAPGPACPTPTTGSTCAPARPA